MSDEILFSEIQQRKRLTTTLYLLIVNAVMLALIYKQIILGQPFTKKPISNLELLLLEVFVLGLTFILVSYKLETQVRRDGIYTKFVPYHFSFRRHAWDTVARAFIRQYLPNSEYKGWGARPDTWGSGRALTVSGDIGLQLVFNNGEKLLIGTRKPAELQAALEQIGQLKP